MVEFENMEQREVLETPNLEGSPNETLDRKLRAYFDGKIVRKDLTKSIKEGANVPVYVLEFLLGQYCSSDDQSVIDEVFGEDKPVIQTIMGNHDYWSENDLSASDHIRSFEKALGQSPWTHYVVNGYHFIGASPNNGSMSCGYKLTSKWLARELEKASKDTPDKPIFVMTHNQPKDTCYGSEDWGDSSLNKVMSKYPNAVIFSGHSHYSILDERSIWQGDYTVLSTQSLSYTELEAGKDSITLSFAAAADDDFVHSYKVVIDGKEEKLFFSDYYNGIGSMSKTVELTLKSDGQKHNYKIYALDSWGAQSKDCIEIGA